jgi:phosphoribosylaminoimidazolecarboxamide formyltransferase/IMP cyclohydrolase
LLHGKPLGFGHFLNLEAATELAAEFTEPACAIVSHAHPAGVAEARSLGEAAKRAYAADPLGCSGGVAAFNREVDSDAAKALAPQYLECIVASGFSPEALDILRQKKDVRLVTLPSMLLSPNEIDLRPVSGGLLIQDKDNRTLLQEIKPVTKRPPGPSEAKAMEFGWKVVKHAKTHAAVLCRGGETLGVGCGQASRMDAVRLAVVKSQERHPIVTPDAAMVLAADGPLSLQHVLEAAEGGVTAIVESGGSSEDKEAVAACDAKGIAMCFTGIRHYRH